MSAAGVGGCFAAGTAALHLVPALTAGHPRTGSRLHGDLLMDRLGTLWICRVTLDFPVYVRGNEVGPALRCLISAVEPIHLVVRLPVYLKVPRNPSMWVRP